MRLPFPAAVAICLLAHSIPAPAPALAEWADRSVPVPVERLIKNTEAFVKERPDDAQGYYVLARIQSLAYATDADKLKVIEPDKDGAQGGLAAFAPWESIMVAVKDRDLSEPAVNLLRSSIANYRKAIDLAPKDAKLWLGLGWMSEQAGKHAGQLGGISRLPGQRKPLDADEREKLTGRIEQLGSKDEAERQAAFDALEQRLEDVRPMLEKYRESDNAALRAQVARLLGMTWNNAAIDAYRRAFELSYEQDVKDKRGQGPEADSSISAEAAGNLIRMLNTMKATDERKDEVARYEKALAGTAEFGQKITPIIFPLQANLSCADLLAHEKTVDFDLAGDGIHRRWPWVNDKAGILVWDPDHTGMIRSGCQLFGSVTWWCAWKDGYQPLALLDDDHDGYLTDGELEGIAVWRDRNGNGVCDAGEVTPVAELEIDRIAVGKTKGADGVLTNPAGIHYASGMSVPTFDWCPVSIPPADARR